MLGKFYCDGHVNTWTNHFPHPEIHNHIGATHLKREHFMAHLCSFVLTCIEISILKKVENVLSEAVMH